MKDATSSRSNWQVMKRYEVCGLIVRPNGDNCNKGHFTSIVLTKDVKEKEETGDSNLDTKNRDDKTEEAEISEDLEDKGIDGQDQECWRTYDDHLELTRYVVGHPPDMEKSVVVAVFMRDVTDRYVEADV